MDQSIVSKEVSVACSMWYASYFLGHSTSVVRIMMFEIYSHSWTLTLCKRETLMGEGEVSQDGTAFTKQVILPCLHNTSWQVERPAVRRWKCTDQRFFCEKQSESTERSEGEKGYIFLNVLLFLPQSNFERNEKMLMYLNWLDTSMHIVLISYSDIITTESDDTSFLQKNGSLCITENGSVVDGSV